MKVGGKLDEIAHTMINKEKEFLRKKETVDNEQLQELIDIHNTSMLDYVYLVEDIFINILGITGDEYSRIIEFTKEEGWDFFDKENFHIATSSENKLS